MRKTKKPQEKNPMASVIKMFLDKDLRSLAIFYGATVKEFEELRSELVKEEVTPKDLKHCQLGRMNVVCDVLSAMLTFLDETPRPNPSSDQKCKALYV